MFEKNENFTNPPLVRKTKISLFLFIIIRRLEQRKEGEKKKAWGSINMLDEGEY